MSFSFFPESIEVDGGGSGVVDDRIGSDRLALWQTLHAGAAAEDTQALARAARASHRRVAPAVRGLGQNAIAGHLGLDLTAEPDRLASAREVLEQHDGLHPLSFGCLAFQVWTMAADDRPAHRIEAAVLGRGWRYRNPRGGGFLPLALASHAALLGAGSAERRLAGWYAGAHQSVLAALLALDRLEAWRVRATEETADLSGRTPGRLIAGLFRRTVMSASSTEAETGASRAVVQRNLDRLAERCLVREITGQGRYRVWAARL